MVSTSTHLHRLLLLLSLSAVHSVDLPNKRKTYIVHVDPNHPKPSVFPTQNDWYSSQLSSASSDAGDPSPSPLLYTYSAALHGFSALLTPSQAHSLLSSSSVVDVYEDPLYTLHTTRTPHFLGLPDDDSVGSPVSADSAALGDVIIGVLDTGVWPESKSFDDAGMPPVPSRWRGDCEPSADFKRSLCNRKLIGARSFSRGFRAAMGGDGEDPPRSGGSRRESVSPRDTDGHGTHTASTAAGLRVANASLFGYAKGTARGIAGRARVAAYKVCWASGCYGSDILAAMERAISDGVDVLSLSLGGGGSSPFFRDTIAVGAFSAVSRGIFVSCSAGNSGPSSSTVANAAPWIATVGAGTLDRDFPSYAVLGNGKKYTGVSLYSGRGMGAKMVPLIYGNGHNSSGLCLPGTLDPAKVHGKVVFCDRGINARVEKGALVKAAGGVGMILANTAANGEELVADSHLLPAVAVGKKTGDLIRNYLRNNLNSMAVLSFGGTVLGIRPSPIVAAFSSRGPSQVVPGILKPDVIGPGVNILAAWSGSTGPTGLANDTRRTGFNIMSGTSMSCPHISGVAAFLKAAHPDWSPSAIKSAMMTTAYTVDNTGSPLRDAAGGGVANPFAYGAGHVNPQKALAPGLVYDAGAQDYIAFLCSLDYTVSQVRAITRQPNATCARRFSDPGQLNYPSFSVSFSGSRRVVKYVREVTNVGPAAGRVVYDVSVSKTSNVSVTVRPARLVFKRVGEKQRYTAWFRSNKAKTDGNPLMEEVAFGWITWSNKQRQVRSPVVYTWKSY